MRAGPRGLQRQRSPKTVQWCYWQRGAGLGSPPLVRCRAGECKEGKKGVCVWVLGGGMGTLTSYAESHLCCGGGGVCVRVSCAYRRVRACVVRACVRVSPRVCVLLAEWGGRVRNSCGVVNNLRAAAIHKLRAWRRYATPPDIPNSTPT